MALASYHDLLSPHGLYTIHQAPAPSNPILPLTKDTSTIYQEQIQIGWKQVYYGCITTTWAMTLMTMHPTINGIVFYSHILTQIWKTILNQWKVSNKHLHPLNHLDDDGTQLQNTI